MQDQILHAKTLMEKGFAIIPLYKDSKANGDKEIITRDYTLAHLQKPLNNHKGEPLWHTDGNQGLNLEKSKLKDIDLENFWSIFGLAHFCKAGSELKSSFKIWCRIMHSLQCDTNV